MKRSEAHLTVKYDEDPRFQPVQGTSMEYAVNISSDVLHVAGRYYAVDKGVWFVGDSPLGPWAVADLVPPEVYSIPPSSPLFHNRYVYVYGSTPDYVYTGYTPGYLGAFVSDGVVVFGTGWYYPGWYGDDWYGWPWTWGFGFGFGYWSGGWFFRPIGGNWWYHQRGYFGRAYSEHWNTHWNPADREGIRNNANVYNRWNSGAVASRNTSVRPAAGTGQHGDLYAGRDGKVYEHTQNGWMQHDNTGTPRSVQPSQSGQLEQQREARTLGQSRTNEFQNSGHSMGMPRTSAPSGVGGGRRR